MNDVTALGQLMHQPCSDESGRAGDEDIGQLAHRVSFSREGWGGTGKRSLPVLEFEKIWNGKVYFTAHGQTSLARGTQRNYAKPQAAVHRLMAIRAAEPPAPNTAHDSKSVPRCCRRACV